jgi:hypothetical protein
MTPSGEVRNRVSLVRDGIPHLNTLGHLRLPNTGVSVIACIKAAGRRVVVSERYNAGVERQEFLRHLLTPRVDAGHAVEAELVGEACEETLVSAQSPSLIFSLAALTSDRVCRFTVEHGGTIVVEVSFAIDRTSSQIVVSLDDWHRLAEVQLLPAVGSATGSVADAPTVLENRGAKSLQKQSLVLAPVSLELFRSHRLDDIKLEIFELVSSSPQREARF